MRSLFKAPLLLIAGTFGLALCLPLAAHADSTWDRTRPEGSFTNRTNTGVALVDVNAVSADERVPSSLKDPTLSNGDGAQAPADMHLFRDRHWE